MSKLTIRRTVTSLTTAWMAMQLLFPSPIMSQEFNTSVAEPPTAISPEAAKIYSAGAESQNDNQFEAAAISWKQFVKDFADDPLVIHAYHYLGICQIQLNQFEAAADSFLHVLKSGKDVPFLEESYVNLGWSHYVLGTQGDRKRLVNAARVFGQHVQKFPEGELLDQSLFYRAESLSQLGENEKAIQDYKRLIEDFPKSHLRQNAMFALGGAQQDLGQLEEAKSTYDGFIKEYEEHALAAEVVLRKAQACMQLGQFVLAEKLFARAANYEGFYAIDQATFQRAYCLSVQEEFKAAAEVYALVATEHPKSDLAQQAELDAGRCFYRANDFGQAVVWLRKVLDKDGESCLEAAHWIGRILLEQKRPEVALGAIEAALEWADGSTLFSQSAESANRGLIPILMLDRAEALEHIAGRERDALDVYQKIIGFSEPASAPLAIYQAARTARSLGETALATDLSQQFLREYVGHELTSKVKALMAESALRSGDHAAAESSLRDLAAEKKSSAGDSSELQLKLSQSLFMQKKYQLAIDALQDVLETLKKPDESARAFYIVGASYVEIGQSQKAIDALSASLMQQPKGDHAPQVCLRLAEALMQTDRTNDARLTLGRMVAAFPEHPLCESALFQLAELDYAGEDYTKAREHYKALLVRFPESQWRDAAMLGLGKIELRLKKHAAALRWMNQLLAGEMNPEFEPQCRHIRAVCLQHIGENLECLAELERYMATDPKPDSRSDAQLIKAACLRDLDRFDEAYETLESMLDSNPVYRGKDQVLYQLGWVAKQMGRAPQSIRRFAQVANQFPNSRFAAEANYHMGDSAYEQDRFEAALAFLETAINASAPGDSIREKSLYKLGWSLIQMNDIETAQKVFAQQVKENPNGSLFADGQFMVGESLLKLKAFPQALAAYEVLSENQSLSDSAKSVMYLHAGQISNVQQDWEQATFWLSRLAREFPGSPYNAKADYELGIASMGHKDWTEATEHLSRAAKGQNQVGAQARFALANLFADQNRWDRAVREYQVLLYGYGGEDADAKTKELQGKAGLAAARLIAQILNDEGVDRVALLERAERIYKHVAETQVGTAAGEEAANYLRRMTQTASAPTNIERQ